MASVTKNNMTVTEAAKFIGISTGRVRQLLRNGELKGEKFGPRAWLVNKKSAQKVKENPHQKGRPRDSKNVA